MSEKEELHILSMGCGVQSTTLFLQDADGLSETKFSAAIFADVGDEPERIYAHLNWLKTVENGAPLLIRKRGCLGDDLLNTDLERVSSIPAFTYNEAADRVGMIGRQCTSDYKINVVEKTIRRELLNLKPRQRVPKNVKVWQYVGFSLDEAGRAARARGRFNLRGWQDVKFPLIEDKMTRQDCINYLEKRVPHHVPRSACVYCPYKSNREWLRLKNAGGTDWNRAVEIDKGLRTQGTPLQKRLNHPAYLHRSCKPLDECHFDEDQLSLFDLECEGGCGL